MQADTTNPVISAQSHVDDLGKFLKERSLKKTELNTELTSVLDKLKLESEGYKEKLLFSVPLTETIVFLNEQILNNLFCNNNGSYPKTGLFLREIDVVYNEFISEAHYNMYRASISFVFNFDRSEFNYEVSVGSLEFNDEDSSLSQQIMGIGFDPSFADKDKYIFVRDVLRDLKDKVFTAQKDLNK